MDVIKRHTCHAKAMSMPPSATRLHLLATAAGHTCCDEVVCERVARVCVCVTKLCACVKELCVKELCVKDLCVCVKKLRVKELCVSAKVVCV